MVAGWFLILFFQAVAEDVVRDDFSGTTLGGRWVKADPANEWKITGNALFVNTEKSPAILCCTAPELSKSFSLSVDVTLNLANTWSGVVIHFQDVNNYYAVRIKSNCRDYQVLRVKEGRTAVLLKGSARKPFLPGHSYTLGVTSDAPFVFNVSIARAGDTELLNPNHIAQDFTQSLSGGTIGLYSGSTSPANPDAVFDNVIFTTF